jgi:uncharacterized protein (TIGR03435 family)
MSLAMNFNDLSPVANHLWQSTVFAIVAWLLTFALRRNRAAVRYWIWLAASIKFLIPLSLLVSVGSHLEWRSAPAITQLHFSNVMNEIGPPFAISPELPAVTAAARAPGDLPIILLGVWACGFTFGLIFWLRSLRKIRAIHRTATPLRLDLAIPAMSSSALLEPSVFGIRKPVLLLPSGITDRLTPAQMESVVAHELCHVRRRDNLTAAIHMVVEVIFWFHPLVWWIRAQLLAEREHACDEEVVKFAEDPQVYAEGILNVCKFYLESPLACASGISGADLKKRIAAIMSNRGVRRLDWRRKMLLAAVGVVALTGPILIGTAYAPGSQAQSQTGAERPAYEVASIKPDNSGSLHTSSHGTKGQIVFTNQTLKRLIARAYGVQLFQVTGPDWMEKVHFDIVARYPPNTKSEDRPLMLRTLLEDRFKLSVHKETKELPGYALMVAKGGSKLRPVEPGGSSTNSKGGRVQILTATKSSMAFLADYLSRSLGETVVDRTGLEGVYDFELRWSTDDEQSSGDNDPDAPPSVFTALQETLGLRLQRQKVPSDLIVVDHVERVPTEN